LVDVHALTEGERDRTRSDQHGNHWVGDQAAQQRPRRHRACPRLLVRAVLDQPLPRLLGPEPPGPLASAVSAWPGAIVATPSSA